MSDTATVDAIRSALDGLIAGCEKLDARIDAMTKNDAGISGAQIETLKREYGRIKGIDPNSESYRKLIVLLDRLGQEELKQLSTAGVPFVSKLALNRVKKDSTARHDYITESGGKFTVHAESGKHMGTYSSKGEAEKRLREIEYFKHKD